jgi:hypothetical protein
MQSLEDIHCPFLGWHRSEHPITHRSMMGSGMFARLRKPLLQLVADFRIIQEIVVRDATAPDDTVSETGVVVARRAIQIDTDDDRVPTGRPTSNRVVGCLLPKPHSDLRCSGRTGLFDEAAPPTTWVLGLTEHTTPPGYHGPILPSFLPLQLPVAEAVKPEHPVRTRDPVLDTVDRDGSPHQMLSIRRQNNLYLVFSNEFRGIAEGHRRDRMRRFLVKRREAAPQPREQLRWTQDSLNAVRTGSDFSDRQVERRRGAFQIPFRPSLGDIKSQMEPSSTLSRKSQ